MPRTKQSSSQRAVGYLRVSTEEQASGGVSLEAQRQKLEAYADLYGLELVEIVTDAGISGKRLDRPGLTEALRMLKQGNADGLLIAKLDRLSRSVGDWDTLIRDYFGERAGYQLWSVADNIDTRSASGRLVLNVLMSVAQWERETIGERTAAALDHKRRKGERVSRHIPYGFDLAPDGIALTANDAEQTVIRRMLKQRSQGWSLGKIATDLERRGITSKSGGKWHRKVIADILARATNPDFRQAAA